MSNRFLEVVSVYAPLKIIFNSYINTVKNRSGTKPKTFGINFENTSLQSVRDIANSYRNHPSIIKIKQVVNGSDVSESDRFSINFSHEASSYIYLYLTNRRQCVGINNTYSQLETIISGFPQESVLGRFCSTYQ